MAVNSALVDCEEYNKFLTLLREEEVKPLITKETLVSWLATAPIQWDAIRKRLERQQGWSYHSNWKRTLLDQSIKRVFKMGRPSRLPVPEPARSTISAGIREHLSVEQLQRMTKASHPQYHDTLIRQWVDQFLEEDACAPPPSVCSASTVVDLDDLEQLSRAPPTTVPPVEEEGAPLQRMAPPYPVAVVQRAAALARVDVERARNLAAVEVDKHRQINQLDVGKQRELNCLEKERCSLLAQTREAELAREKQAKDDDIAREERSLQILERRHVLLMSARPGKRERSPTNGTDNQPFARRTRTTLRVTVSSVRNRTYRGMASLTARVLDAAVAEDDGDAATERHCKALASWFEAQGVAARCGHRYVLRKDNALTRHMPLVYTRDPAGTPTELALVRWCIAGAVLEAMPPNPLDAAMPARWAAAPPGVRAGCDPDGAWRALVAAYPILVSYRARWHGEQSPLARPAPADAVRDVEDAYAERTHVPLAELRGRLRWPECLAADAGVVVRLAKALHRGAPWGSWIDTSGAPGPHRYAAEAVPHLVEAALVVHGFQLGLTAGTAGGVAQMWRLMHLQ